MALYDGNQLPENPTSTFQLGVSLIYTLMVTFYMSLGGLAAWATQKRLTRNPNDKDDSCTCLGIGQLQHPTHYMSDLVHKRNAICRGLLAFIPATFSLAHLYTSSLHSSSLYSAGNVIFAALMGYSAFYTGKTLQQLIIDSDHMDTTKAVYESLYMLASTYDRLRRHKPRNNTEEKPTGIFAKVEKALKPAVGDPSPLPAWQDPWVLFNVFLAIGAQDDARIWPQFSAWLAKFQQSNLTVVVPHADSWIKEVWDLLLWPSWVRVLLHRPGTLKDPNPPPWLTHVAYAYWLYSQDKSIRTITGSMVINQCISDEMQLAGCRSRHLYFTAVGYIDTLTDHVKTSMVELVPLVPNDLVFITETGKELKFSKLAEYCGYIFHNDQAQALSMVCERYVCRRTPAFANLCLPTDTLVPRLYDCWHVLFGEVLEPAFLADDPGYWCRLWLAYMHVVLLAVDLLRMHNNKPYFKDTKCEAGFFKILDKSVAPEVAREPANLSEEFLEHTASVRKSVDVLADKASDAPIEFTDLHDASDRDLYTLAALLATLLLKHRMIEEGVLQAGHAAAAPEPAAGPAPAAAAGGGAAAGGAAPAAAAVRTPTKDPVAAAAGRAAAAAADAAASAATAASVAQAATRQLVARQGGRELALAAMLPAPPRYTLGVVTDKINLNSETQPFRDSLLEHGMQPKTYGDFLQHRSQLVSNNSSLPAIVEGVQCLSAADWVNSLMTPLIAWVMVCGLVATIVSTIACSNGVFLVAVSGLVQALGAWAMLLQLDRLPEHAGDMSILGPGWLLWRIVGWTVWLIWSLFELFLRPGALFVHCFIALLVPNWTLFAWRPRAIHDCAAGLQTQAQKGLSLMKHQTRRQDFDEEKASLPPKHVTPDAPDALDTPAGCMVFCSSAIRIACMTAWWSALWLLGGFFWCVAWVVTSFLEILGRYCQAVAFCVECLLWLWRKVKAWWLGTTRQHRPPREAVAVVLATSVAVAATASQAVGAAAEAAVGSPSIRRQLNGWKDASSGLRCDAELGLEGVLKTAIQAEDVAVTMSADNCGQQNPFVSATGVSLADKVEHAALQGSYQLEHLRRCATELLLQMSHSRIALSSCFENSRRHYYINRISPFNTGVKVMSALFFYTFVILLWLSVQHERWYVGPGMCLGHCHNRNDCQANQTLGLAFFETNPECPGTGALSMPIDEFHSCPWMAQYLKITVNKPVAYLASDNTTMCTAVAKVEVVSSSAGYEQVFNASGGIAVPAVWNSMTDGKNDYNSTQRSARIVGLTNGEGFANFTTPPDKPFNSSLGHGCNLTVLASNITDYVVHGNSSLSNFITWPKDCAACEGDWVLALPCDALCESQGKIVERFAVHEAACAAVCPRHGQNRSLPCGNSTICNCTGGWYESRGCDALCQSWGTRQFRYSVYKPAMQHWVDGELVFGAACEAKHEQTKEERCFNNAKCVTKVHADVYTDPDRPAEGRYHADLGPMPSP